MGLRFVHVVVLDVWISCIKISFRKISFQSLTWRDHFSVQQHSLSFVDSKMMSELDCSNSCYKWFRRSPFSICPEPKISFQSLNSTLACSILNTSGFVDGCHWIYQVYNLLLGLRDCVFVPVIVEFWTLAEYWFACASDWLSRSKHQFDFLSK